MNFTFKEQAHTCPLSKCFPTFEQLCFFRGYVEAGHYLSFDLSFDAIFPCSPIATPDALLRQGFEIRDPENSLVRFAQDKEALEAQLALLFQVRKIAEGKRIGKKANLPTCLAQCFVNNAKCGAEFFVEVFESNIYMSDFSKAFAFTFIARLWSKRANASSKMSDGEITAPNSRRYDMSPKFAFYSKLYMFFKCVMTSLLEKYEKVGEFRNKASFKRKVPTSDRTINLNDTKAVLQLCIEHNANAEIVAFFSKSSPTAVMVKKIFAHLIRKSFASDDNFIIVLTPKTGSPLLRAEDISSLSSNAYELDVSLHGIKMLKSSN